MKSTQNKKIKPVCLTPNNGHYFFGYYDLNPVNADMTYHLAHRTLFMDRLPDASDIADIGIIDMKSKEFIKLAHTTAWNFQQGAMLQWHPKFPNEKIIFNQRGSCGFHGVILDINTGKTQNLSMPVASVSPKGNYALSINFERMFDYRAGYGYAGGKDKFFSENHPENDGVHLVDLCTGKSTLIISYAYLWELTKNAQKETDRKLLVNHINFNKDGTRFVFLLRCFRTANDSDALVSAVMTANTDGSCVEKLLGYTMASHYYWKSAKELMIYSDGPENAQLYIFDDCSERKRVINTAYFTQDGHYSFSPDNSLILYDSYPDCKNYRNLYLYSLSSGKGITLGSYYADPALYKDNWDIRCDLHPRWMPDGKSITFDSTHEGKRSIYYANIEQNL